MVDNAQFRSGRLSNAATGAGLILAVATFGYLVLFSSESELLNTRVRRGGLIKVIEQAIGWEAFVVLMTLFGAWLANYAFVSLWKAVDPTPDVTAYEHHIEFHPAVKRAPVTYDEVSHWSLEYVSGNPVLWIHLYESYWSLQGLFKRKTVKLEGGQEELDPLIDYFCYHPIMGERYAQ